MNAIWHPHKDENGQPKQIDHPTTPTDPAQIADPQKIASFVPGVPVHGSLNDVAFMPWKGAPTTLNAWVVVPGQITLDEPEMIFYNSKHAAAGVIIEEPDGRIWVVAPTNAFAGYKQTFPKGKRDKGLTLQAVAIKECFEESGLQVQITGLVGDFKRSTSTARYYYARRVGGTPADAGWESQAVHLVPKSMLTDFLNTTDDKKIAQHILD